MKILNKMVSFIAVAAAAAPAFAVTARPSVATTMAAARRVPTVTASAVSTTTTTTTTSSTLLANTDCIDAYSECIKATDVCGPNFEECTTRVLFHAQMPKCISTLAQCGTSGVSSLFGTSAISSLSTGATKNSYGEITDYTYPTDGSVLGQYITAGAISNKYDTSTCVKRYSSCLKKDSVCGEDFELCTTNNEFKKQKVFCESTLARCQSDAKIELFGSTTTTTAPQTDSRIGQMISEGAALAAINSVSTCYKVIDQCILNACAANPYKCYESAGVETVNAADAIVNGTMVASVDVTAADTLSKSQVSKYLRSACMDTIGANKYCYATFLGNGVMPTASQVNDLDNQEEIFDEAYGARMNASLKAKITDLVNDFDTDAKDKCAATIKSCAMRACGGGVGAACYSAVFGASGQKSINGAATYDEIKTGCLDIVNTDANCIYAATNPNSTGTYTYSYIKSDAFSTLFPEYDDGNETDPIGAVATLNATLANSYSDAAIADMRKQCQNVATSCVRSLCGTDYINCYRNRTDIYSNLTNTGKTSFDKSMNKVGGVLDYTIVLGLCLDTVKNADICSEHLAIEQRKYTKDDKRSVWGNASSVRGGWIDAGSATKLDDETETVTATDADGNELCRPKGNNGTLQGKCGTVDEQGNLYEEPVTITYITYVQSKAAESLFKDLIFDLEKEAQAKYNAKLTKEQNMCMSLNNGGVMGNREHGAAYMWVKLRNNKVPKNYSVDGLGENHFVASNELYGSFCRVRITMQSNDKYIQDAMRDAKWTTAYFAVGDRFTCGSWIPSDELDEISQRVGCEKAGGVWDKGGKKCNVTEQQERARRWVTALGSVLGATGGFFAGDAINQASGLGGLAVGNKKNTGLEQCDNAIKQIRTSLNSISVNGDKVTGAEYVDGIVTMAQRIATTATAGKAYSVDIVAAAKALKSAVAQYQTTAKFNPYNETVLKKNYDDSVAGLGDRKVLADAVTTAQNDYNQAYRNYQIKLAEKGDVNDAEVKKLKALSDTYAGFLDDAQKKLNEYDSKATGFSNTYNQSMNANVTGASDKQAAADAVASAKLNVQSAVDILDGECNGIDDDKKKLRAAALTVMPVALGAAGGFISYYGMRDAQEAKLTEAQKEAMDEWMNEIGDHLECYVGGESVGTYGDSAAITLE